MTRFRLFTVCLAIIALTPLAAQTPSVPAPPAAPSAPAWRSFLQAGYADTNDLLQRYFSELVTAHWSRALPFGSKAVEGAAGPASVSVEDAGKFFYIAFARGAKLGLSGDRVVERNKEKSGVLLQAKVFFRDGGDSYVRIRPPNYATTSLDVIAYGAVAAKDIPVGQMMLYVLPYGMERIAELSAKAFDWNRVFRSAPDSQATRLAQGMVAGDAERGAWKPLLDSLRKADAASLGTELTSSTYTLFAADADLRATAQPYLPFPRHDAGGWPLKTLRALAFEASSGDDAAFLVLSPAASGKGELRFLLVPYRGAKGFGFAAWDLSARAALDPAALAAADPERRARIFRVSLTGR